MKKIICPIALIFLLVMCKKESSNNKNFKPMDNDRYEVLDPSFFEIVDTIGQMEVLAEGYTWAEGPLWLDSMQTLIWSDVPKNTIYQWSEGSAVSVYLTPSGNTTNDAWREGSNGLILNSNGKLVLCQHGDRQVAEMQSTLKEPKAAYTTLTKEFDGHRFNSPNDATYDTKNRLYFTDPPYGLKEQDSSPEKELTFNGVYRLDKDGSVKLLIDSLSRPNGIAIGPKEDYLIVANSDENRAIWVKYTLGADGTLSNGKILHDATVKTKNEIGLPDGLKITKNGVVFGTGPGGVYVFDANDQLVGIIKTEKATANCALDAKEKYLYLTTTDIVQRLRLK